MIGIHAGARSKTQVTRPGAASKNRAPNWRKACSQTGAGGWASITAIARLCPPRDTGRGTSPFIGRWRAAPEGPRRRGGNTNRLPNLVMHMNNLQHFDAPTFEADVLNAPEPVVVDFYA